MHRRQYLPGSGRNGAPTLSRRQLQDVNVRLRAKAETAEKIAKAEREARHREREANEQRENSGIRGFFNKAKRVLTKPLFSKSAGAR